ncbi:GTPase HflX [compost metagenome]
MNAMIELYNPGAHKQVFAKDMLFATLETSVRSIRLPDRKSFLLTDTVGFVSQLPHHLVKAFRSTLEEVTEADLLIHVVDIANPEYVKHTNVTNSTLKELGADHIPMIFAYNKSDLTEHSYPQVKDESVYLSAQQNRGIEELTQLIRDHVFQNYMQCEIVIPYEQSRLVAYFNEHAHVQSTNYEPNGTRLKLECRVSDYEQYRADFLPL